MYRRTSYIIARIVSLIFLLLLAVIVAVQTPTVQTKISEVALEKIKPMLSGSIQCESVSIMPTGALLLENIVILDAEAYHDERTSSVFSSDSVITMTDDDEVNLGTSPKLFRQIDTLAKVGRITVTFSPTTLINKGLSIRLNRITVNDGELNIVIEPGTNRHSISNIERIFKMPAPTGKRGEPGPDILFARKIKVENFHFTLQSYIAKSIWPGHGIDFTDMDLFANVEGRNFFMKGSKIGGLCDKLTAKEKSGYEVLQASARVSAGYGKVQLNNLHLIDPWSNIYLKEYSMINATPSDYADYIHKILMEAHFDEFRLSLFSFHTLHYFTKGFNDNLFNFEISQGSFKGYVNDFAVKDLAFTEQYTGAKAIAECEFIGIPDVDKMALKAKVSNLRLTKTFAGISPRLRTVANINANGPLNRLKININLNSKEGSAIINTDVRNLMNPKRANEIFAKLSTNELNIGAFVNELKDFGPLSINTQASAKLGTSELKAFSLDSLKIDKFTFKGLEYKDIVAKADYEDDSIFADISSNDEKIKFSFNASANNVSSLQSITKLDSVNFKVNGDFEKIDFDAMRINTNDNFSEMRFKLFCDLGMNSGILNGEALVNNIFVTNNNGEKAVEDIVFKAHHNGKYYYELNSHLLELSLIGDGTLIDFSNDIISLTAERELPALISAKDDQKSLKNTYELSLLTFDTRGILDYIKPGLYIADSTRVHLDIENGQNLIANIVSPRIAIGKTYIKDLDIQIDNIGESLNLGLYGSELKLGEFGVNEPLISAFADDNRYNLALSLGEFSGEGSRAEFFVDGMMYRDSADVLVLTAHPHDSHLDIDKENIWSLDECNISTRSGDFFIRDFKFFNKEQEISIDGGYSSTIQDTLALNLKNVDISLVDKFIAGESKLDIKGELNGKAYITSDPELSIGMLSNLVISDLAIGGVNGGNFLLSSELHESGEAISIYLKQAIEQRNAFLVNGEYNLKDGRLNLSSELDNYPISLAGPFVQSIISKIDGGLSGSINFYGTFDNLTSSSENLKLSKASITLVPTGATYTIDGPIRLTNNGLYFDNLSLNDDSLGSGAINGSLNFEHFSNFRLNTRVDFNGLKLIDLSSTNNSGLPIYGQIRGIGTASVTGPFDALNVNAVVSTTNRGEFHFITTNSLTGKTGDLLTFIEPIVEIDPYDEMIMKMSQKEKKQNDLNIQAQVNLHPGLTAYIDMGGEEGNGASFNGEGAVNIHIRPSRSVMNLNGEYNFTEGNYRFILPGILNKNFEIQRGSNVSFGGDIMDTRLDINALYSLKTSLSTIISSGSSVAERRQVDCGINISDRLRNPNIAFSIDVPDLDPATKTEFQSVLSTDDKIQKQFLALLVMGSFIPDENSGVVNGSSLLLSNATELMSNQLNSILTKLNVPFDIGFGYQGTNTGSDIFDVAISTQLFNNRVIVGGSVGNRRYGTTTTNDVVGNLDIQIKIDPDGKYRLSLFSHSADAYSSYLDNSQRNGVGFSYIFTPKKKEEKEAVVITIENEQ